MIQIKTPFYKEMLKFLLIYTFQFTPLAFTGFHAIKNSGFCIMKTKNAYFGKSTLVYNCVQDIFGREQSKQVLSQPDVNQKDILNVLDNSDKERVKTLLNIGWNSNLNDPL